MIEVILPFLSILQYILAGANHQSHMAQREIATRGMSVQMREKVILKLTFPAKRTESRSIGLARATGKRMHGEMEILSSTLKRQKTQYRHDVVDGVAIANPRHPYI